jgi:hypothetical protein
VLQQIGPFVPPVDDCEIPEVAAFAYPGIDRAGDPLGLLRIRDKMANERRIRSGAIRFAGDAPLPPLDQMVRGAHQSGGRAKVLVELEVSRPVVGPEPAQHLIRIASPKSEDRLIWIGDDHHLPPRDRSGCDGGQQAVLLAREIVVLVDEDKTNPLVERFADMLMLPDEIGGQHDQIVEVEQLGFPHLQAIGRFERRHDGFVERGALHRRPIRIALALSEPITGLAHLIRPEHRYARGRRRQPDQIFASIVVTDLKRFRNANFGTVPPQEIVGPAMQGRRTHVRIGIFSDPVLELPPGLIGVGQREDLLGFRVTALQEPGDPLRDGVRLAAAGGSDDQHMPIEALMLYDAPLTV